MTEIIGELVPPTRLMLTPGPSCVDPRVYRAMATPLVGHLDPWFLEMMGDVQTLLRRVFQTQNRITYPISASGSGGIEAAVFNVLEEGDECIVCSNGMFSERMAVIAERTPAKVIRVTAPLGRPVDPEDVRRAGKGRNINGSCGTPRTIPESRGRTGRAACGRHRRDAGRHSSERRSRARGHLLQRFAEGFERAAGNGSHHSELARRRRDSRAQEAGAKLVFRFDAGHGLLGQGANVSSHSAHLADLRHARGVALRAGGRPRGALGTALAEPAGAGRRDRSNGPRPLRGRSG